MDRQQLGRVIYGIGAIVAPLFVALAVADGNWLSVALYSGITIWLWGQLLAGNDHPQALAIVRFLSGIVAMSVLVALIAYHGNWAIGVPVIAAAILVVGWNIRVAVSLWRSR